MGQPLSELVTFCKHIEKYLHFLHQPATFWTKIVHSSQWHSTLSRRDAVMRWKMEMTSQLYVFHYWAPLAVEQLERNWSLCPTFPFILESIAPLSVKFVSSVLRNTRKVGIKLKLQVHFSSGKQDVLMKQYFPACLCGWRGSCSTDILKDITWFGDSVIF